MRNIHIEVKGCPFTKGDKVMLFDKQLLRMNWDDAAVEVIKQSLQDGKWKKLGKTEIRATLEQGDEQGWLTIT